MTLPARMVAKIQIDGNGCWIWQGAKLAKGYGMARLDGRSRLVHRVSYELNVGPIPEGLQIDHLCRVTSCCNPEHLEPVTARENVFRSPNSVATLNAAKTHCKRGHEFTDDNALTWRGRRLCRSCRIATSRAWRTERRVSA